MSFPLGCLLAYLIGGIPFGLVLVRLFKGVDIRQLGSGNVGATNASRAFGPKAKLPIFFLIYLLDTAKGFLPAFFGPDLVDGPASAGVWLGSCAIVGHCASPYLGLRGGKGVATTTGVVAAFDLISLSISFAAFLVVFGITRAVFMGSLALGATLAVAIILRDVDTAFTSRIVETCFGLAVAAFLLFTHRSNIKGKL